MYFLTTSLKEAAIAAQRFCDITKESGYSRKFFLPGVVKRSCPHITRVDAANHLKQRFPKYGSRPKPGSQKVKKWVVPKQYRQEVVKIETTCNIARIIKSGIARIIRSGCN